MIENFKKNLGLPFAKEKSILDLNEFEATEQKLDHELMVQVTGAKVLFANYAVIQSDFPEIWNQHTSLSDDPEAEIDEWLVNSTAFISSSQVNSTGINSMIHTGSITSSAWRPPRYGRAAILGQPVSNQNENHFLFDVKGTGVPSGEKPTLPNSNGLLTISEAIHEVMMEHLVFACMRHANINIRPLPTYAVIDLGFNALNRIGRSSERAVLLLRRTTTRPRYQWERYYQGREIATALMNVELNLRRYGLSASHCGAVRFHVKNENGDIRAKRDGNTIHLQGFVQEQLQKELEIKKSKETIIDGVNVQIAGQPQMNPFSMSIMDFGRYRFCNRFNNDLYSWIDADYQNLNGVYLSSKNKKYIQPDPKLNLAKVPEMSNFIVLKEYIKNYETENIQPNIIAMKLFDVITKATAKLRNDY